MNVSKIQELSKQCCALQTFKDRCTWNDADFTVGTCRLSSDATARIKPGVLGVVGVEIKKLQAEITKAVGI